jgi:hypothetical protein
MMSGTALFVIASVIATEHAAFAVSNVVKQVNDLAKPNPMWSPLQAIPSACASDCRDQPGSSEREEDL